MTCVQCSFDFCWNCKAPWSKCRGGPICRTISVWKAPIWGSNTLERAAKKCIGMPIVTGVGCAVLGLGIGAAAVAGGTCIALASPVLLVMGAKKVYKHSKRCRNRDTLDVQFDMYRTMELQIEPRFSKSYDESLMYDEGMPTSLSRSRSWLSSDLSDADIISSIPKRPVDVAALQSRIEELERSLRDLEAVTFNRMESVRVRDMQGRNRALMEQIRTTKMSLDGVDTKIDAGAASADAAGSDSDVDLADDYYDEESVLTAGEITLDDANMYSCEARGFSEEPILV
jgi:hypothetical protein